MIDKFDKEREFPNYFAEILQALTATSGGDKDRAYTKVIALLEKNIGLVLKKLQLSFDGGPGQTPLSADSLFNGLESRLQGIVSKWNADHPGDPEVELNVYLGSGIIRSILSYIYKELHSILENRPLHEAPKPNSLEELMQQTINGPEFNLIRQSMVGYNEGLHTLFVLGSDSDFNLYYEANNLPNELRILIENAAADFISHTTKSVSELHGGAFKGALHFTPKNSSHAPLTFKLGKDPSLMHFGENLQSLREFIDGFCVFVKDGTDSEQEAALDTLRTLLELPFLAIKDIETLKQILSTIDSNNLDQKLQVKFNTIFQNAYYCVANNRVHRESGPLEILRGHVPMFISKERIHAGRYISGTMEIPLLPITDFLEEYCSRNINGEYELYHGTASPETMLSIVKGGFITSNQEIKQGLSVFGSGLYTTKSLQLAQDHSSYYFALNMQNNPNMRVCNIKDFTEEQIQILGNEVANSDGLYTDLNDLLRKKYKIDIIINEHVIIQNMNAFNAPSLTEVLGVVGSQALKNIESLDLDGWDNGCTPIRLAILQEIGTIAGILDMYKTGLTIISKPTRNFIGEIEASIQRLIETIIKSDPEESDLNKCFKAYFVMQEFKKYNLLSTLKADSILVTLKKKIDNCYPTIDLDQTQFMKVVDMFNQNTSTEEIAILSSFLKKINHPIILDNKCKVTLKNVLSKILSNDEDLYKKLVAAYKFPPPLPPRRGARPTGTSM